MKKFLSLIIAGLLIFFLVGCSSASETSAEIAEEETDMITTGEIIGVWENTEKSKEDDIEIEKTTTFTFNEDGTFEEVVETTEDGTTTKNSVTGTYDLDEYELVLSAEVADEQTDTSEEDIFIATAITVEFDGDEMTLTPKGSTAFVFTRVD